MALTIGEAIGLNNALHHEDASKDMVNLAVAQVRELMKQQKISVHEALSKIEGPDYLKNIILTNISVRTRDKYKEFFTKRN